VKGGLGCSPKALCRSGVWGNAPMALRRSRGSRGWPLGVINNQIGGFGRSPKALCRSGGWGNAPIALRRSKGSRGWPLGA